MTVQHGFFTANGRQLYGSLYLPDSQPRSTVVICEPFADEKRCAFRMLVRLSEKLMSGGAAVLRFDVSGTGDSSLAHSETDWESWCQETVEAVDYARLKTGVQDCCIMGFRSGALLAAYAAGKAGCRKLSLVEPILSGSALLKDIELRQGIQSMMNAKAKVNDGTAEQVEDSLPEGYRDFAGFVVNPTLAAQLSSADLTALCQGLEGTSIQLIRVSGGKNFPPNWKTLVEMANASPNGQSMIIADKPFWGQVDYFESDAVIEPLLQFA